MALVGQIRRMYLRDNMSFSEIARRTSLSRNTVKKWLKVPEAAPPKYRRRDTPGKLTAFEGQLVQALEADAHRPKRDRRTARALCAQLPSSGLSGTATVASCSHALGTDQ